jgi:toxin FitB
VTGYLLDTNVIASLIAANGAPSVKAWAAQQDEDDLWLSILTLGEYDKGIAKLPDNDPNRARYIAARDALEDRFAGRILPLSNEIVRRWGSISGTIRRETGHPPPVIDTLFAATAVAYQLCFVTRNVKDVAGSGAGVLNPWLGGEPL